MEPVAVSIPSDGVPRTFGEVSALRAQRSELSNQLRSAQGRRDDVAKELANASAAERPGLEARLKLLDQRILEIEGEIARTGELIAKTDGSLLATTGSPPPFVPGLPMNSGDLTGVLITFTIFVLSPIAFTVARMLWKRANHPPPKVDLQAEERMRRLEAGVDAIAIEVERISEGQRFVTRLLAEREKQQAALPGKD